MSYSLWTLNSLTESDMRSSLMTSIVILSTNSPAEISIEMLIRHIPCQYFFVTATSRWRTAVLHRAFLFPSRWSHPSAANSELPDHTFRSLHGQYMQLSSIFLGHRSIDFQAT